MARSEDGRVVFVRHALPGETVRVRVTSKTASFWRAEAVEVLDASPDRVNSPWPEAGPGGVGGGELGHVALPAQRRWKAQVVAEQLRRIARLDREVEVEPVPGPPEATEGLGYRTRVEFVADAEGRLGMHLVRTHQVLALTSMPLAVDAITELDLFSQRFSAGSRVEVVAPSDGTPVVLVDAAPRKLPRPDGGRTASGRFVRERVPSPVGELRYRVPADAFWQVHTGAPAVLVDAVLGAASGGDIASLTASRVVDLYSGVGLYTVPLARAVGEEGAVVSVEGDAGAVRSSKRNLHDAPHARLLAGDVARTLRDRDDVRGDVVVLDPPRAGARRPVVDAIAARGPARVVHVACDPAALARDVSLFAGHGYRLASLRAFDLFPMTHHVECVAVLDRVQ